MHQSQQIQQATTDVYQNFVKWLPSHAGELMPETAALSILALEASGLAAERLLPLRQWLIPWQAPTGAVALDPETGLIYWPTGWAILAWHDVPSLAAQREQAVGFLRTAMGMHRPPNPGGALGHDTSLRGWPWVDGTHSWVQPTAIAVLGLQAAGQGTYDRVLQASQMLLDRQLPDGGWNYGNTRVFRNILRPMPEDTGYALVALRPFAQRPQVEASLAYLRQVVGTLRAPAALAWSILGLSAWGLRPERALHYLEESLAQQARVGTYAPRYQAQLVLAYHASTGRLPCVPNGLIQ